MGKKDNGGPAFPQHRFEPTNGGGGYWTQVGGMTLRDWFAGQALAGMLADPNVRGGDIFTTCSADAYRFADAMLEARK